jgi:serine protease Do
VGPADSGFRFVARQRGPQPALELQSAFNQAADIIRPAVVNINAISRSRTPQPAAPGVPQFANPFDGIPDKVFGNLAYESVGSGVIVDPAGYVVTNNHLVVGATSFMVSLYKHQNEHRAARLVTTDPQHDLALLKLEGNGPFPTATFADSSRVEVGDWVLAVGNPFGLGHTVTAGIISGRRASITIGGLVYRGLLQTDAPINQGSSGGPLVNLSGEIVGINTAIYAPTGVFNGTGFAIPANRVGAFVTQKLQPRTRPVALATPTPAPGVGASPSAPWLGLSLIDVTPALAAKLAVPGGGVFVTSVVPGSPASEAEISRGDVLLAVGGRPIRSSAQVQQMVPALPQNRTIPVTVWRNGRVRELSLKVGASPWARP